jgi:hypothetical protein
MAAPDPQNRNTRRHPAGMGPATRSHARIGAARPSRGLCGRPGKPDPGGGAECASCRRLAGACNCDIAARPRLTPRGSRIGSSGENARKSGGFDGFRRRAAGASGQQAVKRRALRSGARAAGRCALDAGRSSRTQTPARSWRTVRGRARSVRGREFRNACTAHGNARTPLHAAYVHEVGARGTRLAVDSSRVRFRLGDAPGIEEKAG